LTSRKKVFDSVSRRICKLDHPALGLERLDRVKPDGAEVSMEQIATADLLVHDLGAISALLADNVSRLDCRSRHAD